ncbi:MAG TPA: hypothetical protein VGM03_08815 [Phycisphaerae bacterium]|jgi:hypothetical protein
MISKLICALAVIAALALGACNDHKEDASKFKAVNSSTPAPKPSGATTQPRSASGGSARPSENPPPLSPEQAQRGELPPGHPPVGGGLPAPSAAPHDTQMRAAVGEIRIDGLIAKVPDEWKPQVPTPGPFAPQLQYGLPKVEGDSEDAVVKIFVNPATRGKAEPVVNRWITQFELPPGTPPPPVEAKTRDGIEFKQLDISGTFNGGGPMMGGGGPQPDYRMIAVFIDDPDGPHQVKVTGPKATVEKWKPSIDKFLDSIKPAS